MEERGTKKTLLGTVESTKMEKTISVKVERRLPHPRIKKYYPQSKMYLVHDPDNQAQVGDLIKITECRPMSRHKRWRLLEIVTRKP